MNTLLRLLEYSKRYWTALLLSVVAASLYGLVSAFPTYIIKHAVDDIFIKKFSHLIIPFMVLFIFFFLLKGVFEYITAYSMNWVGNRVINDIRSDFFEKIIHFPLSFFQENSTGKLMSHFLNDIQMVQNASSAAIKNGFRSIFETVFLIGFAFFQNWKLAVLMLIAGPVIAITIRRMGRAIKRASLGIQTEVGSISSMLQEVLVGIREIKAFNGERLEINRFRKQLDKCFKSVMMHIHVESLLPAFTEVIAMLGGSLVFYIAIKQVLDGTITPGQLSSFIAAVLLTYQPLKRLANVYSDVQYGIAAADRVFTIMDTQYPTMHNRTLTVNSFSQQLTFDHVSFHYDEVRPVLSDINLVINKGECIGIFGPSGSGKSTFCDLLLGFVCPTSGAIRLDGHDLAHVSSASLRDRIGYVGQRTFLFNDSVNSNVAYALPDASRSDVVNACKLAHADEFVTKLSRGYDTLVGENGTFLSGGQKQRLTIARALLKDPEILIFDEATSSLDQESERMIRLTLEELRRKKTLVIVSHRFSLLENVDRLFLIQDTGVHEVAKEYLKHPKHELRQTA